MATATAFGLRGSPERRLAQQKADELSAPFGTPPIPVKEIAEKSGVEVVFNTFDKYRDMVAGFCDFEAHRIFVNANDSVVRQLATIAHELGHWVLNREYFLTNPQAYKVLLRFDKPDPEDRFEDQANHFAAHLLIPQRLLRIFKDAPISVLATVFVASQEMLEYRLKNG